MHDLVRTGLARSDEAALIGCEEVSNVFSSKWWLPIRWSVQILHQAKQDEMIRNAPGYSHLLCRLAEFRNSLTEVTNYCHIPVPLVYTQVVHLAVYVYFAVSLVGEQWIIWRQPGDEEVDLYYPIFMTVRFLFIFGWLRVAETLYNPFGEDDEDFELNELLDRHFRVAMDLVNDKEDPPQLRKDIYWNENHPHLTDLLTEIK